MKIHKLLLTISGLIIAHSLCGMQQIGHYKPMKQPKSGFSQKPLFSSFHTNEIISEEPRQKINGLPTEVVLANMIYGDNTKKIGSFIDPRCSIEHFEKAAELASQSQKLASIGISKQLPLSTYFNTSSHAQNITEETYDKFLTVPAEIKTISVVGKEWIKMQSHLPQEVKDAFGPDTKVQLVRTPGQKAIHVITHTTTGVVYGVAGNAIFNLASDGAKSVVGNVLTNIETDLGAAASDRGIEFLKGGMKVFAKAALNNSGKAFEIGLDDATYWLNTREIGPFADHGIGCVEKDYFTTWITSASATMIHSGINACKEHAKANGLETVSDIVLNNINSDAIQGITINSNQFSNTLVGGLTGGTLGLVHGLTTMDNPIQEAHPSNM